jgi:hypothetical protein
LLVGRSPHRLNGMFPVRSGESLTLTAGFPSLYAPV